MNSFSVLLIREVAEKSNGKDSIGAFHIVHGLKFIESVEN